MFTCFPPKPLIITAYIIPACVIIALTFFPFSVCALPAARILNIQHHIDSHKEVISIHMSGPVKYHTFTLTQPNRIVIDIPGSYLPENHTNQSLNGRSIRVCRASQNRQDRTRIVLDLKQQADFEVFTQSPPGGTGQTLRVEVTPKEQSNVMPFDSKISDNIITQSSAGSTGQTLRVEVSPKEQKNVTQFDSEIPDDSITQSPPGSTGQTLRVEVTPKEQSNVMLFESEMPDDIFNTSTNTDDHSTENGKRSTFPLILSGSTFTRFQRDADKNEANTPSGGNEQLEGIINKTLLAAEWKDALTVSALSDYRYNGHRNRHEVYDLSLFDAYIAHRGEDVSFKIGKQIRRWGKADQFSPVDTLNPEDLREFYTLEYEDRKIPVWMADATVKLGSIFLEAAYLPRFKSMELDYFETDWAVYPHLKEDLWDNPAVPHELKNYFKQISVHETSPNDNGLNGEIALQLSTSIKGWDVGATYHYTWEDTPFFKSFPVKGLDVDGSMTGTEILSILDGATIAGDTIEVAYVRSHIVGIAFETTLSQFGFRGEAAWHSDQPLLTADLTSITSPVLYTIVGADYTGKQNWYLNLQLSYSHISDFDDAILYFKRDTFALLGELNKDFFSSWVTASLHYHITINEHQYYLSPRVECSYIPDLDIVLGLHLFEGSPYSFMGRFDENDQLFLDLTYHF